jgi:hypothetical protein
MTVKMIATIKHLQCLSTDEFPLTDVPEGSTMHVVDTGEEYVFFDGVWEKDLRLIAALRAV